MSQLFLGFYFGVIFTILIYNIQWYVNSKEKSYLYYVLMQLSIIFVFLHAYEIFDSSLFFTIAGTFVFAILFLKEFLNIKKHYPAFDRFLDRFVWLYILFITCLYILDLKYILEQIPQAILFFPFLILGYILYKKGNNLALYFIIGWGIFTISILATYILNNFGEPSIFNRYIIHFGNLFEAIILSFALSKKTKMIMDEKNQQEKMLIHQSRLASMGEMLANISHQWRQPLNRIAAFIMNMQLHIYDHYKKENYLLGKLEESQEQLEYMSNTIDDFSNFYKKDKTKEKFHVSTVINNAVNIIKSSLQAQQVELTINLNSDIELNSYPKELAQVILNIVQNAKDQLLIKNIKNPRILIEVNPMKISIEDNAKGINDVIINRIFEPYFTTKEKHKGTGLGLYMSKIILEKDFNASINIQNTKDGAQFNILFS